MNKVENIFESAKADDGGEEPQKIESSTIELIGANKQTNDATPKET